MNIEKLIDEELVEASGKLLSRINGWDFIGRDQQPGHEEREVIWRVCARGYIETEADQGTVDELIDARPELGKLTWVFAKTRGARSMYDCKFDQWNDLSEYKVRKTLEPFFAIVNGIFRPVKLVTKLIFAHG